MVAELLARSPSILLATVNHSPVQAMAMEGSLEQYIEPGIRNVNLEEMVEIIVGGSLLRVTLASFATILGVAVAEEAKDTLVQALVKKFGKYQNESQILAVKDQNESQNLAVKDKDPEKGVTGINDIETNEFDGSPDASKQLFKEAEVEEEDVATKSVTYKKEMFNALASNKGSKNTEAEQKEKKVSLQEMLDLQREALEENTKQLLTQQDLRRKEEMATAMEKWRQENLETTTKLRQQETKIAEQETQIEALKKQTNKEASDTTPESWYGQSPGPDVLQKKVEAPLAQTPMMARMETPDKSWGEISDKQVKEWAGHVRKTGRQAPQEFIIEGKLVHNFRELVQQETGQQGNGGGKFKYITKTNKQSPYETPQKNNVRLLYSPSYSSSDGDSPGGGEDKDIHNLGYGGSGHNNGGHGGSPDDNEDPVIANSSTNNYGRDDREFQLVNARTIIITPFSGRNLPANPYLPFNNASRRLIMVQGKDGNSY